VFGVQQVAGIKYAPKTPNYNKLINSLINLGGKAEAVSGVSIDVNEVVRQFPRAEIVHCRAIKTSWISYIESNALIRRKRYWIT
jgi:hypothetical protein